MTSRIFRVATRASQLALTQTKQTVALLEKANPGIAFELVTIRTSGDASTNTPLAGFGGVGVFVKELETALREDRADLAIHSLKDVPSSVAQGMVIAAIPSRVSPWDVVITNSGLSLDKIPHGAKVGTGSPRRIMQLKAIRPDLRCEDIRGNLDTRIKKLSQGDFDAIILAAAGMIRLGIAFNQNGVLSLSQCIPACGQGALGLECRADDAETVSIVRKINDATSEQEATAERSFMKRTGAGCAVPVAAFAKISEKNLVIRAVAGDLTTGAIVSSEKSGPSEEFNRIGIACADEILTKCAEHGITLSPERRS